MNNVSREFFFRKFLAGNIRSWIRIEYAWELLMKASEVCTGADPKDITLPWCLGLEESKLMCEKFQGQLTTITNLEMQKRLFFQLEPILNYIPDCDYEGVWTGFTDRLIEGHFIDVNNGISLNATGGFSPFVHGQPNGDVVENCATVPIIYLNKSKSWFDTRCEQKFVSLCRIDYSPILRVRGECVSMKLLIIFGRIDTNFSIFKRTKL